MAQATQPSSLLAGKAHIGEAAPTGVRWRIFAVVFALVVINLMDRTALSIAMPPIGRELDLSPTMRS